MVQKKKVVKRALCLEGPLSYLPRGELFIDKSFLNTFFPGQQSYFEKLKGVLSLLDLDIVGIFPCGENFVKESRFNEFEDMFLVCNVQGPFSFWIRHLGFLETLKAFRKDKSTILDISKIFLREFKANLLSYGELGFNGIAIVDDIAGNEGTFFSRNDFQTLLKPLYAEMVQMVKSLDLFAFFHSDGNLEEYLRDFARMGFDCLHTFDARGGMDVYKMRENLQEPVCFMGHIDLFGWNVERIKQEVERAKETFLSGGLILGSTSGLCQGLLKERVFALYPSLKKDRKWNKLK